MSACFLDDLEKLETATPRTEIVRAPPRQLSVEEQQMAKLRSIETELLVETTGIVAGVLHFADIDPKSPDGIPQEWIDELGMKDAIRRHRLATYGIMSAKEAPIAIKVATSVHASITKARATENAGPRTLNMTLVQMTAPPQHYESVEVED